MDARDKQSAFNLFLDITWKVNEIAEVSYKLAVKIYVIQLNRAAAGSLINATAKPTHV